MLHNALEITREYRLDFDVLEADWDDPLLPEVTSKVLGRKTTYTMTSHWPSRLVADGSRPRSDGRCDLCRVDEDCHQHRI